MENIWRKRLFVDLATDKKPESRIPPRSLVEVRKKQGIQNPIHTASYASVAAGKRNGNDDEEKSPLSTSLPATPERFKETGLAKLARLTKVDQVKKKAESRADSYEN